MSKAYRKMVGGTWYLVEPKASIDTTWSNTYWTKSPSDSDNVLMIERY